MFFNNLQNNHTAANVDQQSTLESTPESTLCVELSDEELSAVNGGLLAVGVGVGAGVVVGPVAVGVGLGLSVVVH